jgi:subtilisin family serine protease
MEKNYLVSGIGRSLVFLTAFIFLIVLGVIQPYASEDVVQFTNSHVLAKNKVVGLSPMMSSRNKKLPDMFPKPSALSKKLQQLEQNHQYLKATLPAERLLSRPFSESLALKKGEKRNVDQESSDIPGRSRGVISRGLPYEPEEVLVKFKPFTSSSASQSILSTIGMQRVKHYKLVDVHLTKTSPGMKVKEAIETLKKNPAVEYAEPNYLWHASATLPNDPDFGLQWGLHNTGQTGGTNDADIDAPEAWDVETGSGDVVIAVIDTGVDYNHVDLAGNMWTNPGEIPGDAIDNDGNGYVDDVYGINSIDGSGDPMDDAADVYHGTHCAGIIAAVGNNSTGITGVCWTAKIMALKFLNEGGSGSTSNAIECVEYMVNMKNTYGVNVKVSSNSWGGGSYSTALEGAINLAGDSGIIFVAAAGNGGSNNDISPHYPDGYDCLNIISVASSDHNDVLAGSSQYGYNSVDVAAPGVSIWSTKKDNAYRYLSGTSMAAPHVSGLAGLIFANNPALSSLDVKERIFRTVDTKSFLEDIIASGGKINAYNALTLSIPPGPFIYSLSPGIVAYGDKLIIEGTDFGISQGSGSVTFSNNVISPIISWSENQIATTVPDGCQTGPVTVTTDGGLVSNGKILTLAGSISGTVSEENTGNAVEGVYIDVFDTNGYRISSVYSPTGNYSVKLPTGNYYVHTFALTCHIDEWYQDAVPWESDPPPVSVVAPDNTPNINFVLELGGSISGRVTDAQTGEGIPYVLMDVYDSNGEWVPWLMWLYPNGDYTICKLPTDDYYLHTWNDQGYIDEWYQGAEPGSSPPPVHVEAPNDTPDINFALTKGGSISGRIVDPTGVAIETSVNVYDGNGNYMGYDWSDSEGHYTVNG